MLQFKNPQIGRGVLAVITLLTSLLLATTLQAKTPNDDGKPAIDAEFARTLPALRTEFLAAIDAEERLGRLLELERQALALIEDEPLKMGSLGAAILDIYPASQTGHLAMQRYYAHLEADAASAGHDLQLATIRQQMLDSGDGTAESPYQVMSIYDAHAFAAAEQMDPVGSVYQSSDAIPFAIMLVVKPEQTKLRQLFFDLTHMTWAISAPLGGDANAAAGKSGQQSRQTHPWSLIRKLAADMDSAAQTAIGAFLAREQKFDDAVGWLKVASRTGNLLANTLLAKIYLSQSEQASGKEQQELRELASENYLHAIALGSTEAMYTMANLYLADYFGPDNTESALTLLRQAGELEHAESLLYLAHLYSAGNFVEADKQQAAEHFRAAAALQSTAAILGYGRFLTTEAKPTPANDPIYAHLKALIDADNDGDAAEAMIILGNLHARGVAPRASTRNAVRWYKKAVRKAPEDPDVVNEVAWTLTVSDIAPLQRNRYALKIMEKMMQAVASAQQRPEYLDTWAAAYAANGQFDRAIELQNTAIEKATEQKRDDVLDILNDHLQQFQQGTVINEPAP